MQKGLVVEILTNEHLSMPTLLISSSEMKLMFLWSQNNLL